MSIRPTKYCSACGQVIDAQAEICPKCGVRVMPIPTLQKMQKPVSNAWYLLPLFLGLIGGIIGYFCIRNQDNGKANDLVVVGFIVTGLIWIFVR